MNLLRKFNFTIKQTADGFDVLRTASSSTSNLRSEIVKTSELDFFEFELISSDRYFNYYTEIPLQQQEDFSFDTNIKKETSIPNCFQVDPQMVKSDDNIMNGKLIIRFNALKDGIQFNLHFKARATKWQYFVINKSVLPLNQLSIRSEGSISFVNEGIVTLANGQQATLFSSSSLIPLTETPISKFDLINESSPAKVIIKGLPTPNLQGFSKVNSAQPDVTTSPIYIYI